MNHHWTKALAASADGRFLYVGIGSNSNITERGMLAEVDRAQMDATTDEPAGRGQNEFWPSVVDHRQLREPRLEHGRTEPFNHNATISSRTRSGTFSGFSNFDPGEERLMV
jgi:hypothetical protein